MEYVILAQDDIAHLITLVNKYIGMGWRPQGGVSRHEDIYHQAMVRKAPKVED